MREFVGNNYISVSSVDLTSSLELLGRIPPSVCWDYIDKIRKNPTKEILVLKLWPSNNDEQESYHFSNTSVLGTGRTLSGYLSA